MEKQYGDKLCITKNRPSTSFGAVFYKKYIEISIDIPYFFGRINGNIVTSRSGLFMRTAKRRSPKP